jgi:ATP-dependent Clp protease ATP-binding subunit ClpC
MDTMPNEGQNVQDPTAGGRRVLALAQEEARIRHHEALGTEHLVLAILGERDGVALSLLKQMRLSLEQIRRDIEHALPAGDPLAVPEEIPFRTEVKRVIEGAIDEAHVLRHTCVGSEHLLGGLLKEETGIGGRVLRTRGASLHEVRQLLGMDEQLLRLLEGNLGH